MGLDVYLYRGEHREESEDGSGGCDYRTDKVELPSSLYPDHLFRVGYFRSSYNQTGINSILQQYHLPDLAALIEPPDDYAFTPDWPAVIARSDSALADFDAAMDRMRYVARSEMVLQFDCPDAATALTIYQEEMRKEHGRGDAWSSRRGTFWPDGVQVHAVIPGRNAIGSPCVYTVECQSDETIAWYRHALEIVRETAVWVLGQPDPKAFHVHWSS